MTTTRRAALTAFKVGHCSFCGKDARLAAQVGTTEIAPRMCDECLGLCCGILAELVGTKAEDARASEFPAEWVGKIVSRVAKKAAAGELSPRKKKGDVDECWCCSFCHAPEEEVAMLIAGPRVYICETCVGDAVAFLHQTSTKAE